MNKLTGIIFAVFLVASVSGYVLNIGKIIGLVDEPFTSEVVVRGVGVFFFPLGVVAGYF